MKGKAEVEQKRAHGVTPGLNKDYTRRKAEHQAAFVLPYLKPGMNLLDVGCGPGTITLGLADRVKPGPVTGIDHDKINIESAEKIAVKKNITNVSFRMADAFTLPFKENSFDAVFENNLFVHLSDRAIDSAREIFRVLKNGGFFAARDADADSVVWGNQNETLKEFDKIFYLWQQSRGSEITIGKKLPVILREAGFINTIKTVSADTKGDPESVKSHAGIIISLLEGPLKKFIVDNNLGDSFFLGYLKENFISWGEHPDSFFANVHVEVIGWKQT